MVNPPDELTYNGLNAPVKLSWFPPGPRSENETVPVTVTALALCVGKNGTSAKAPTSTHGCTRILSPFERHSKMVANFGPDVYISGKIAVDYASD